MRFSTILTAASVSSLAYATKPPCTQAEIALATGIHLNIQVQWAEYNGTLNVIKAETTCSEADAPLAFAAAKGALQAELQEGINLRYFNQQIAPKDNPALPGLAKVQGAQSTEKEQVDNLTGSYLDDKEALEMLKTEIMGGIKVNEGNLEDATSLCDFTLVFPPANEMFVYP